MPSQPRLFDPIPFLFEDAACVVFNKPAGVLVIPTDKGGDFTLTDMVNQQYPQWGGLYPGHRLDRGTSGVILYAKGKEHQQRIMELFRAKRVQKEYIAFVHGCPQQTKGRIKIPVKDFHARTFAKHLPAQSALTEYSITQYYKDFSVARVVPITGRTNQIRIHFAKIGHPLVGEDKYAFRRDFTLRFRRPALHARRLCWPSLVTGKPVEVVVDVPEDMQDFLLRQQKGQS